MVIRKTRHYAGISRIDQPEKRTHGFFVRLVRNRKVHNAFFADLKCGGKARALKAAQKHYRKLLRKHGRMSRRAWAQIKRRTSASGIVGVRKAALRRGRRKLWYWVATWSPRPGVVGRKMFSINKYGASKAKALAVQARNAGVRSMKD
jgi:hypothetical protein